MVWRSLEDILKGRESLLFSEGMKQGILKVRAIERPTGQAQSLGVQEMTLILMVGMAWGPQGNGVKLTKLKCLKFL